MTAEIAGTAEAVDSTLRCTLETEGGQLRSLAVLAEGQQRTTPRRPWLHGGMP